MRYDVFVSFASKDIKAAKQVKEHLDSESLKCFFGSELSDEGGVCPEHIISAMKNSEILLVLFSSDASKSYNILRDILLADNKGLTLLPVRIQDVTPLNAASPLCMYAIPFSALPL